MKTKKTLFLLLLFTVFMHGADERVTMLKALEADPIPDEMVAKINALPSGSELSPEIVACLRAFEATAKKPDYTNYKRSATWGRVLPEARFFNRECYAVPSQPLYYESITHAGNASDDVTHFLISGPDEQSVEQVAKHVRKNSVRSLKMLEEQWGDVDVVQQKIEHGCEVLMARELRNRLLVDVGPCSHEAGACSTYHSRVKAWLKNQEKAEGSKDLAIMLFACIRGSIITE